jgi:chromosome segregation ATPase
MELTTQAESKFFSLIELMTNASKEASSLKEYWSRLMSDREGFEQEREELLMRIDEVTETLERKEDQHHHHGRELGERKKEVERLLIELSAALNEVTARKHDISERDHELERTRARITELSLNISRSQTDNDSAKIDLENALSKLRAREDERDHAKQDAEKYRDELRSLTREHTEIKGKYTDISSKYESTRREVSTLTDRIKAWERKFSFFHDHSDIR